MNAFSPATRQRQLAALPWRRDASGTLQVLLITSRGSGQWIVPKGNPIPGRTASEAAAQEAREEAGVVGEVSGDVVGTFSYVKDRGQRNERFIPVVDVYPLRVTRQLTLWPEMGQRRMVWLDAAEAAQRVDIPELAEIITRFIPQAGG